jgi:hypothetical protein
VVAWVGLLGLVAACGKGPAGTTASTPPTSDDDGSAVVEPADDGASTTTATPADPPAGDDVEELHIDGVHLRLQTTGCALTATFLDEERRHRFEPFPGACHFALGRDGLPWVVPTDHGKAVLVGSSVPVQAGEDCETALQVVVITERGPELSRQVQRVSSCGPGPWDEMMYHVLASDRVGMSAG